MGNLDGDHIEALPVFRRVVELVFLGYLPSGIFNYTRDTYLSTVGALQDFTRRNGIVQAEVW